MIYEYKIYEENILFLIIRMIYVFKIISNFNWGKVILSIELVSFLIFRDIGIVLNGF